MMSLEKFIEYLDIEKNYSKHTVIAYKTDLINFQDFLIDSNYKVEIESADYKFCLLYTSPSPRDMRRSRMPSSA